ncbi:alpha/beta fold hydrolase [Legionella anisa]|uniref:alpha/beta fold hydrolase n=1 Tax=Legionella anisa TaxID=28082 RepID=UPI00104192BC|nr:alpha/beta hydrolase [Legionella anisa]
MDIVVISGALTTPKLWHHQEQLFPQVHYVDVLSDSIGEMAQRFKEKAPKRFTLIGFSMGGYVALELYKLIPTQIEQLILINSGARLISDKGQLERERSLELIQKGKFDLLIKLIFKNSLYNQKKYDDLYPLIHDMAFEVGADNYKKQLNAILNKPDHSELLESIDCPTLLIASRLDQVMPVERSEHMAKHIKKSKLIYMEECGHMAMLEQPEQLNQILAHYL